MNSQTKSKQLVRAALLVAMGILLPIFFHGIKQAGAIFLPMHIPVLIGGFLLNPIYAMFVGILAPILSHIFTAMPPFPFVYVMTFELLTYGLVVSIMYNKVKAGVYPSLIVGMLCGRAINILGNFTILHLIMMKPFKLKFVIAGLFVKGLPGIIIQLVLIPILIYALQKSNLGKANITNGK